MLENELYKIEINNPNFSIYLQYPTNDKEAILLAKKYVDQQQAKGKMNNARIFESIEHLRKEVENETKI